MSLCHYCVCLWGKNTIEQTTQQLKWEIILNASRIIEIHNNFHNYLKKAVGPTMLQELQNKSECIFMHFNAYTKLLNMVPVSVVLRFGLHFQIKEDIFRSVTMHTLELNI